MAVLIIGYQRKKEIQAVIKSVSKFKPDKVYLAMDGPKTNNEISKLNCEKARDAALKGINWECEIYTKFSSSNCGLRKFMFSSIDWFFTFEKEGLILEDDILIHPQFIDFAKKFINLNNISCVSACTFENELKPYQNNPSYSFLSPIPSIWGWYCRSSIWHEFRSQKRSKLSPFFYFIKFKKKISFWQSFIFSMILWYMDQGKMESWAYEFLYYSIKNDKISVFPGICMAENIGNSPYAENCHTTDPLSSKLRKEKINLSNLNLNPKLNQAYIKKQSYNSILNKDIKIKAIKGFIKYLLITTNEIKNKIKII